MGVTAKAVPFVKEVTPSAVDQAQHDTDLLRERCLLFRRGHPRPGSATRALERGTQPVPAAGCRATVGLRPDPEGSA